MHFRKKRLQFFMEQLTSKNKKPWNPVHFLWIGIFFSFLPSGIMCALNFEQLGVPKKKKPVFIAVVLGFVILVSVPFIMPTFGQASLFLNGSIVASLYFSQKHLFKKHIAAGGGRASIKVPLILSFLLAFTYAGIGLGVVFYQQSQTSDVLQDLQEKTYLIQMINDQEYDIAEPRLVKYEEAHPEDTDNYWNLAILYVQTDRLQLALRQLEELKKIDPGYEGLENHMKEVQGYINDPGSYEEQKMLKKFLDEIDSQIETQQFDLAENSLLDYKKSYPDDERIIMKLANLYTKTDRLEEAKIEMEEYLVNHPQSPEVMEFLKEMIQ